MANLRDARGLTWWIFWRAGIAIVLVLYAAALILGRVFVAVAVGLRLDPAVAAPAFYVATAAIYAGIAFLILNFVVSRAIGRKFGTRTLAFLSNSGGASPDARETAS